MIQKDTEEMEEMELDIGYMKRYCIIANESMMSKID